MPLQSLRSYASDIDARNNHSRPQVDLRVFVSNWQSHQLPLLQVSEGLDVLAAINEAFVDDAGVPIQNIRVRHTIVLEDPFPDPPALAEHVPEKSPEPAVAQVG